MESKSDRDVQSSEGKKPIDERKSEATSKETLSDIEEIQDESNLESPKEDPGPSPDGRLDEPEELKDAGPM
jgi:hypothetical protein